MRISATKNRFWEVVIDGKSYTVKEATEFLGLGNYNGLTIALRKYKKEEDLLKWLKDLMWKLENGAPLKDKVYVGKGADGKEDRCAVTVVLDQVKDLTEEGARVRLKKWETNKIPYEKLFVPMIYNYNQIGKNEPKRSNDNLDHITAGDLCHLTNKSRARDLSKIKVGTHDEIARKRAGGPGWEYSYTDFTHRS